MGGFWSSSRSIEQHVNYISSSLNHHNDCIEGLVKTLESQQVQFNILSQAKDSPVPSGVVKALEYKNEDGSADVKKPEELSPLERDMVTLMKANQLSLQCHAKVVQTSFSTLEEVIQESTRQLASGNRTDSGLIGARCRIDMINSLKRRVDVLEQKNNEQQMENENLRQKNEEHKNERTNQEKRYSDLESELESKEAWYKHEIECLNQLLRDREKTTQVQLFYQSRGDTMAKIVDWLKSLLVDKLDMDRNKIQFIDCQSEQDVNPEIPMLILCINTSRLEREAGTALQTLKGCEMENIALLIFHHENEHALPTQTSDRVLAGPEFKALRGMFDLAFLTGKGMYVCEMNTLAVTGITDFICKVSAKACSTHCNTDTTSTMLCR